MLLTDYEFDSYRTSDLVKLDILLAGDVVDELVYCSQRQSIRSARGLATV